MDGRRGEEKKKGRPPLFLVVASSRGKKERGECLPCSSYITSRRGEGKEGRRSILLLSFIPLAVKTTEKRISIFFLLLLLPPQASKRRKKKLKKKRKRKGLRPGSFLPFHDDCRGGNSKKKKKKGKRREARENRRNWISQDARRKARKEIQPEKKGERSVHGVGFVFRDRRRGEKKRDKRGGREGMAEALFSPFGPR